MYLEGRKVLVKSLYGSHNYNLNTEKSDRDYKVFVVPSFEDMYDGIQFTKSVVGTLEDFSAYDIRRLPWLFYKANENFLESLTTEDLYLSEDEADYELLKNIWNKADEILTMNLPHMFGSCKGMFHREMKELLCTTGNAKELCDLHGYNTKNAFHGYRILDFAKRFYDRDFNDFAGALKYDAAGREFLLNIKHGGYSEKEFRRLVMDKYENEFLKIEAEYCKFKANDKLLDELLKTVKKLVNNHWQTIGRGV